MSEKVSSSRLAWGSWHGSKKTGEGDVHAAYSADAICDGQPIRKPFSFRGAQWVTTSMCDKSRKAYRVVPLGAFRGTPTSYAEKIHADHGEQARSDPMGFYHGMKVKYSGSWCVIVGPETEFVPGEEEQPALLALAADPEHRTRIDAERVTLELKQKSARKADAGQRPIAESPLFGGPAQGSLF